VKSSRSRNNLLILWWFLLGLYFVIASGGGGSGFVSGAMAMFCGFMVARSIATVLEEPSSGSTDQQADTAA
jgi:hypothetical protein